MGTRSQLELGRENLLSLLPSEAVGLTTARLPVLGKAGKPWAADPQGWALVPALPLSSCVPSVKGP